MLPIHPPSQHGESKGSEHRMSKQTERFRRFWADTQNLEMDAVQSRINDAYESLLPNHESVGEIANIGVLSPPEEPYPAVLEPELRARSQPCQRTQPPVFQSVHRGSVSPSGLPRTSPGWPPKSPPARSTKVPSEAKTTPPNDYQAFRNRLMGLLSPSSTKPSVGISFDRLPPSPRRQVMSKEGPVMRSYKSVPMTRLVDRHNHGEATHPRRLQAITEEFETTPSRSREFFQVPLASSFQDLSNVPIESRSGSPTPPRPQTKDEATLDPDVDAKPKIRLPGSTRTKDSLINEDAEIENDQSENVRSRRGGKGRKKSRAPTKA